MKKLVSLLLTFALILLNLFAFSSCGNSGKYVVGICQYDKHTALDAATQGFMDALKDKLGDDVTFDLQNAAGEFAVVGTIIDVFVSKNVDLIMANATPALQVAAGSTSTIPVLGTSVTEYGVALGIENFSGTVGGNISGTSDLAPLEKQADMLVELLPDAQNIGILYCSAEANSAYQVKVIREYLTDHYGKTCTEYSFTDSNDVETITRRAATESDALYIPTDNKAASCAETIRANVGKTPVFAGEEGICKACGFATLSISYYELGRLTGEMAAQILTGEKDISEMPIGYDAVPVKKYNKEICDELGITVPSDYVQIED